MESDNPSTPVTIYVVTMFAVYDQGLCGVFNSREAAEHHAQRLIDDSDGHHDFRINEVRLGEGIFPEARWASPDRDRVVKRQASVEFVPHARPTR